VFRRPSRSTTIYRHLLAPSDLSERSQAAALEAARLAGALGARLTYFHALPTPTVLHLLQETLPGLDQNPSLMSPDEIRACMATVAGDHLDALVGIARGQGVSAARESAEADQPHRGILDAAGRLGCDLIVMASHGRSGVGGLLLGSVTQKVLAQGSIPVLVYPPSLARERGPGADAQR
jgi:nucleotide-binding universal stress UspA family protein